MKEYTQSLSGFEYKGQIQGPLMTRYDDAVEELPSNLQPKFPLSVYPVVTKKYKNTELMFFMGRWFAIDNSAEVIIRKKKKK